MDEENNNQVKPISEWHEDDGDVLWWKFPISEPPYVGSPLCSDWPGYHTHWTSIEVPKEPWENNIQKGEMQPDYIFYIGERIDEYLYEIQRIAKRDEIIKTQMYCHIDEIQKLTKDLRIMTSQPN